mmetsp:Transcript_530/g.1822  ORF Transcript_530/g.1822 Transcript_530/m.1822 type:complete len:293 (+) Transcript_530:1329-2207(+)
MECPGALCGREELHIGLAARPPVLGRCGRHNPGDAKALEEPLNVRGGGLVWQTPQPQYSSGTVLRRGAGTTSRIGASRIIVAAGRRQPVRGQRHLLLSQHRLHKAALARTGDHLLVWGRVELHVPVAHQAPLHRGQCTPSLLKRGELNVRLAAGPAIGTQGHLGHSIQPVARPESGDLLHGRREGQPPHPQHSSHRALRRWPCRQPIRGSVTKLVGCGRIDLHVPVAQVRAVPLQSARRNFNRRQRHHGFAVDAARRPQAEADSLHPQAAEEGPDLRLPRRERQAAKAHKRL